ncbi:hypothetical protein, partial [Streptococcus uberis]|uniref:hypothetical protein n=1 Tax=Streptococcus uberis TaxID=1349 RepID=UPI003D6A90F4
MVAVDVLDLLPWLMRILRSSYWYIPWSKPILETFGASVHAIEVADALTLVFWGTEDIVEHPTFVTLRDTRRQS